MDFQHVLDLGPDATRRVLAAIDGILASIQGAIDNLETQASALVDVARRVTEEGPSAVRAEMGEEDFDAAVVRMAAVVYGLGMTATLRIARETLAASLD